MEHLDRLKEIGRHLATEVVFAEPGKDTGLLPVNCLVSDAERLLRGGDSPEVLLQALQCARRWLDSLFAADAIWTAAALQRFGGWASWMQEATLAWAEGQSLAALPVEWSTPPDTVASASVAGPAPAAPPAAPSAAQEPTLLISVASDGDLLREFLNESAEHLQNIEQGVLVLEDTPGDADTLNSIFRAFHTFKGGSGFLNLAPIQTLAHQLESLLDAARNGKLVITSSIADLILEGGDTLKRFMVEIDSRLAGRSPATPIEVPTLALLGRIRAVLDAQPGSVQSTPALASSPVSTSTTNAASAASAVVAAAIAPVLKAAELMTGRGAALTTGTAVKVDTSKLDNLVDLVGELVIAQSLVVQNRALNALEDQQLGRDLAQMGRITRDLQRTAMSLRMVPIRSTFQKMNRLVRDIAAKIGKQVELVCEGEETEMDRTIVEEIADPLVHMIRNAIDHGIEMPEVRRQRGKPARGTVSLRAFHQGGNIVIEIKDDGSGLDKKRLLAKAIEKGLVRADTDMSEREIFNMIFAAGFSTAEKVTDLSGRGVGMDVVRRNIEKLRGKVEIQSVAGEGSTFSIYLPLTLAIIDGLIVGIGEQRYILPSLSVCESFRPTRDMLGSVQGRGEMLNVRGRLRPVLRLREHLGLASDGKDSTESIAIVVEAGKDSRCVLVDQLLGKQEVVIKSLGETFKSSSAVSGAAILGDGGVGLILDPNALVHLNGQGYLQAA